MKTLKISVSDMQSNHCQQNVRRALETLEGAEIVSIFPGKVQVTVPETTDALTVLEVIRTAGYTAAAAAPEKRNSDDSVSEKTVQYKTNINCSGCVEKVTNALNNIEGIGHWDVDTGSPDKTLSVHYTDSAENDLLEAVREKGFHIEPIN